MRSMLHVFVTYYTFITPLRQHIHNTVILYIKLYIDCFHSNCLICYIYYDLISHPWQHSSVPLVV